MGSVLHAGVWKRKQHIVMRHVMSFLEASAEAEQGILICLQRHLFSPTRNAKTRKESALFALLNCFQASSLKEKNSSLKKRPPTSRWTPKKASKKWGPPWGDFCACVFLMPATKCRARCGPILHTEATTIPVPPPINEHETLIRCRKRKPRNNTTALSRRNKPRRTPHSQTRHEPVR